MACPCPYLQKWKKKIFGLAKWLRGVVVVVVAKKKLHRDDREHLQRRENIANMEGRSNHTFESIR